MQPVTQPTLGCTWDGNGRTQSRCTWNGTACRATYCLEVMTSDSSGDGDLDVSVETGDGQVQEATGHHANGALVMKRCYVQKFTAVLLCDSGSNTWRGSVGYLQDDAYTYLICVLCGGTSNSLASIVVSNDASGALTAPTECLNGNTNEGVSRHHLHGTVVRFLTLIGVGGTAYLTLMGHGHPEA